MRLKTANVVATLAVLGIFGSIANITAGSASGGKPESARGRGHREPIVIGHRGASGYRPEHTLAAYELAIEMGADYIEPDLVSTEDGVLVARHENEISATTDVEDHPEFASRQTTKLIDGNAITGWFTEDFTLAELKSLRAEERIPDVRPRNTVFDGLYEIPTLQEVIDLAQSERVGIYPEIKHPTYFDGIGLSLEEPLVQILEDNGYRKQRDPVFIQSFEVSNLIELDDMTKLPLVQLVDASGAPFDFIDSGDPRTYADMITERGLKEIAVYAEGIGANKNLVIPRDAEGDLAEPTDLVNRAHRRGLIVHAWTFRNENSFLPANLRPGDSASPLFDQAVGNAPAEYEAFFATRLDGLFSDNPDTAVASRTKTFGHR